MSELNEYLKKENPTPFDQWEASGLLEAFKIHSHKVILYEKLEDMRLTLLAHGSKKHERLEVVIFPVVTAITNRIIRNKLDLSFDYDPYKIMRAVDSLEVYEDAKRIYKDITDSYETTFEGLDSFDIEAEACSNLSRMLAHKYVIKYK